MTAHIPSWFKVPTPLGNYNPDWAVLVEKHGSERLFFVVETKSTLFTDDLRDRDSGKIKCGEAHFGGLMHDGDNPARFIKASKLDCREAFKGEQFVRAKADRLKRLVTRGERRGVLRSWVRERGE